MNTFIALLRGINVGKARRVPMADLRRLLAELGYSGVATLLNSGNAVFLGGGEPCEYHAAQIAQAVAAHLNVEVPVIVKTAQELTAVISENSLAKTADDYSRLLVAFMQDNQALSDLAVVAPLVVPPEQFAIGKNAAYLSCVNGILKSKAGEALLGKAGKSVTTRNWATVLKLQALVSKSTPG